MSFNINWDMVPVDRAEALRFLTRMFYIHLVSNLHGYEAIMEGDEVLRLAGLAHDHAIEALELGPP